MTRTILGIGVVIFFVFSVGYTVFATTPNPGHPWTDVGDGTFIVTGPTTARTYTFPDANATVLTTNALVAVTQGGTGLNSIAQGDILYGSASNTLSALAKSTSATRYLSNTGSSNNPAWAQVDLTNGVTGILPGGNGGSGNAYLSFTGPTTSTKTFTLPNASSTILTSNDVVTMAQGGTATAYVGASTGGIYISFNSQLSISLSNATAGKILGSRSSTTPTWSSAVYPSTAGTASTILRSDGTNFVNSTATYPDTGGTIGKVLTSDGTNFASTFLPDQVQYTNVNIYPVTNIVATAIASGTSMFQYIGVAPKAYTTCKVLSFQSQALSGVTWSEIAIFKGAVVLNGNASLTLLGYADISAYSGSNVKRLTTVTVSGTAAGDQLWVAFGSSATGTYQVRGALLDDIQGGTVQTAAVRPSAAGSPQATTIGGATLAPGQFNVNCS